MKKKLKNPCQNAAREQKKPLARSGSLVHTNKIGLE